MLAELSLRGWNRKHPAVSYPPMTWELAVVASVQLVRHGWLKHAIGVLLAFDCFLRVGELVGLRKSDVADRGDVRVGSTHRRMLIRLRQTKTGVNQWVEVESTEVQWLIRHLVRSVQVVKLSYLGSQLIILGLDSRKFVPNLGYQLLMFLIHFVMVVQLDGICRVSSLRTSY